MGNLKAVIAISNPFDLLVTTLRLQATAFGAYEKFIWLNLMEGYKNNQFRYKDKLPPFELLKRHKHILDLDNVTRAKKFGYASGHELYKAISCD